MSDRCGVVPALGRLAAQDPPDGTRPGADPELAELALDPDATPPRILPAETRDEIDRLAIKRRPTRSSPTVSPLAPDELAMPPKERPRRDHERGPSVPRQRPARRGEERPVAVLQLWTPDRAAEHPHLVAEGGVLKLELRDAPSVGEQSEQANEHEVGEGSQGARMLPATLNESGTEYWSPTRSSRGCSG